MACSKEILFYLCKRANAKTFVLVKILKRNSLHKTTLYGGCVCVSVYFVT